VYIIYIQLLATLFYDHQFGLNCSPSFNNGQHWSGYTIGGWVKVDAFALYPLVYVAGLEGQHDIIQYAKPSPLSKVDQTVMECISKGYPKHCMMKCSEVCSGEMTWGILKSIILKAGEEHGYTIRGTQCDKSTVIANSVEPKKPFSGWTYSLGCYRSILYKIHQASFLNSGGNEMFEQDNTVTFVSTYIILKLTDIITFQPMEMCITWHSGLHVYLLVAFQRRNVPEIHYDVPIHVVLWIWRRCPIGVGHQPVFQLKLVII
jgi:hypothetical protein